MNADAFRHLYGYHFSENRILWERYVEPLSPAAFTQVAGYSHGSVRDQLVHLIDVDEIWFCELQNREPSAPLPSQEQDDRQRLRTHWDGIEQMMQRYLATLQDAMLFTTPIQEPDEDRNLLVWQVLVHVINHGTDHRAQLLRQLNELGVETVSQDYIFYVYEHPVNGAEHDKV
jgi:uncharacterized damage-inducible protein DinB